MNRLQIILFVLIIILAFFLRFYRLGSNPPGLYWDEAAFGYDAYSLAKTARDHHGQFLPLFFESFGDWKLPGYFYLLIPSVKLFGLSEFAVRLPSALLGFLTVMIFFFVIKKLTDDVRLALASMFFLAISPWHLQFSRAGFESTAGLFFFMLGALFFLRFLSTKYSLTIGPSLLFFILSMYFYHAYRIFTPLMVIALFIIYFDKFKKFISKLILPIIVSLVLFLPILLFTFSTQGRARAISQSAFNKSSYEIARVNYDQKSKKPLRFLSKYWNKPVYFSYIAINNYVDHFSPIFLFIAGDQIGRHSQVDVGQIYPFELILLIFSLFAIKKLDKKTTKVMLSFLLLAAIPAAIVVPTPHAYRTLQMSVPLAFFSGVGFTYLLSQKKLLIFKLLILAVIFYSFVTYLHLSYVHYPKKFSADWQDGYREMVRKIQKYQGNFQHVYVTNINQVPYIYLLFYQKYNPQKFIQTGGTKDTFDKYVFIDDQTEIYNKGKILYVAPSWKKVDGVWLDAVDDSAGRHIYSLWEVNGQN